jgi:hypothetical protein
MKSLPEECLEGSYNFCIIKISADQQKLARLSKSLSGHLVEVDTGGNRRAGVVQAVPADLVVSCIVLSYSIRRGKAYFF